MNALEKTLVKMKKNNVRCECNCTFEKLTTLGCGGKIYLTLFPESVSQLVFVAKYLYRHKITHCFLGHGSNVLASDDFYSGVAVVTSFVRDFSVQGDTVVASCGMSTSKLCSQLVNRGLTGGEFLGCLPATVGGAVVCNAGCFGQSVQDVVQSVVVLHNGKREKLSKEQCRFVKRGSIFKNNGDFLVLQVKMRFEKSTPAKVQEKLSQMRQKKAATQPLGCRSAGCVLFNDKIALSKLIDEAHLKGYRVGGAQVSEKHAGFVINLDKATSTDIYLLIRYIKKTLAEKFGVSAKLEVCLVNFPTDAEQLF